MRRRRLKGTGTKRVNIDRTLSNITTTPTADLQPLKIRTTESRDSMHIATLRSDNPLTNTTDNNVTHNTIFIRNIGEFSSLLIAHRQRINIKMR